MIWLNFYHKLWFYRWMSDTASTTVALGGSQGWPASLRRPGIVEHLPPVCAVGLIYALDLLWNSWARLTFTGWSTPLASFAILAAISTLYATVRRKPRLAELAFYSALWIALSVGGAVMSYLAGRTTLPFADSAFLRFDAAMGFDWVLWVDFVRGNPTLNGVLRAAYDSLLPQVFGSVLLFAFAGIKGRNAELVLTVCVGTILTGAIAALLPALGPWVHFGYGALVPSDTAYVAHTLALREEHAPAFALDGMQGIVCFPSFHTALAMIFTYVHRGIRWSFPLVAAINALMLLSIPSEGGHYLTDMLGGALVAAASIAAVSGTRRRLHPTAATTRIAPQPSPAPAA